jgi:hypothetical protein
MRNAMAVCLAQLVVARRAGAQLDDAQAVGMSGVVSELFVAELGEQRRVRDRDSSCRIR